MGFGVSPGGSVWKGKKWTGGWSGGQFLVLQLESPSDREEWGQEGPTGGTRLGELGPGCGMKTSCSIQALLVLQLKKSQQVRGVMGGQL